MGMDRVFVTRPIPEAGLARLRGVCELSVRDAPLPPAAGELAAGIRGAAGLLCHVTDAVTAEVMQAAGDLRVISNFAVGFNNIDVAAATRLGIAVGNTPGVLTEATADLAMALLLAAARYLRQGIEDVAAGRWRTWEPLGYRGQELTGKTLGVVGLGRIGTALARRCRGGWGMRVLYCNPRPNVTAETELGAGRVDLQRLLRESDFVSLHCPMTEATRGLMGREQFRLMKPSAVFVNTSRGGLVDEAAMTTALAERWIFAAGLDVTEPEPPDAGNPLLRLPNVVLTPHVGSATVAARDRMAELAAENVLAGLGGRPLPHPVNSAGRRQNSA
jgi:lactate dehydrogenase-like 2-hydroxyacid dehydrogenase